MKCDLFVSCDWIEYTFVQLIDLDSVFEYLHFCRDEFHDCSHGLYGYRSMIKHNEYEIYIMFDGSLEMGIHVRISGHSISYFISRYKYNPGFECLSNEFSEDLLRDVLRNLLYVGRFTRFDLALDDVGSCFFSVNDIKRYLRKDQYSSRFKYYSFISGYSSEDNSICGNTVYLGRRQSDIFIRIYDKKLEHDFKLPDEDPLPDPVTRWELELKHAAAHEAVELFVSDNNILAFVFFSYLVSNFRVIKNDASRKTRCSTLPKFADFIGNIGSARVSHSRKILNIDQRKSWLVNQCSKSLAMCNAADPEFMSDLLDIGSDLLTSSDLTLVSAYRR